jgi:predicted unusual protein kinase regulating ubiquinone biosynthesis (AarF/ABC1/UbiB family)
MITFKPKHLGRYSTLARLLVKYGRSDLVSEAGLEAELRRGEVDLGAESSIGDASIGDAPIRDAATAGPEEFARDLERLGPAYIKLGQLLSTRADLLPPEYLKALERLQDDVQPVPFEVIERIVTTELGVRLARGFAEFDPQPLATASLGQVHRAKLRDGREVVVKVQRPGVRAEVIDDLEAMLELVDFLDAHTKFARRYGLKSIVDSLHETLLAELDYRQEAENALALGANLKAFTSFVIPQPIPSYVSSRVITLEYLSGTKITDLDPTVLIELDRRGLAEQFVSVYLHQILVDGLFHADPHPGNVFLTRDRRLGLIDFGMVVRLSPDRQQQLLRLLLAVADGEGGEAARVAREMGSEGHEFDERVFTERIDRLLVAQRGKPVEQIQTGRLIMHIQSIAGDCGLRLPHELYMVGKTMLNLDRVVETLDPALDPNEIIRRRSTEIVVEHGRNRLSLHRLYQSLLDAGELVQNLPQRLNRVTKLIADNELRVRVDSLDEHKLIKGMQKIANRITTGLVLAALIVGAALMMHLHSSLTIFGMNATAFVFFVVAATTSLWLVLKSAFKDE